MNDRDIQWVEEDADEAKAAAMAELRAGLSRVRVDTSGWRALVEEDIGVKTYTSDVVELSLPQNLDASNAAAPSA